MINIFLIIILILIINIISITNVKAYNPETDVIFKLITKQQLSFGGSGVQIHYNDKYSLDQSGFDNQIPTIFIIHGWTGLINERENLNTVLINAFFEHHSVNIITVDWTAGSADVNYFISCQNVNITAFVLAKLIDFLVRIGGTKSELITIIGYSVGAHVAGVAGKHTKSGLIGTIIALDPAGPNFDYSNPSNRLARGDARYVEVIHTNSDLIGYRYPIGDADFFPNGGIQQPGCILFDVNCSHYRSVELYVESINSRCGFWGQRCRDFQMARRQNCGGSTDPLVRMGGEPLSKRMASGVYYFPTRSWAPYAIGANIMLG